MNSISVLSDSNDYSGNSYLSNLENPSLENSTSPDVTALQRLSVNLESIFGSTEYDFYSDSKIVFTDSCEIPVHRCILAARSPFFKRVFLDLKEKGGKLELKDLCKDFDVGFDALSVVLGYLYTGKVRPLPREVCACVDEECLHVGCRPAVDFMVEVLYASFTFQISELVTLFQRRLLDILDKVAVDDILVILSVAKTCENACECLTMECIHIVTKSDVDLVTLEKALPQDVVKEIMDSRSEISYDDPEINKYARKILRALDSDDVELVRKLLSEGHTSLDEAHALHYAVAYCDAKTTKELLEIGLADVNNKNQRRYTVLHVAAMRKDPGIIMSLLTMGAQATDITPDGRKALQISKRLTKSVDYFQDTKRGTYSPKDRLCIELLERAERKDPPLGIESPVLTTAGYDLVYLEKRVDLARILFPMEAQLAMDIAKVHGTPEFQLDPELNEALSALEEKYHERLRALSKTVELGKHFFPRCSNYLDKLLDTQNLSKLMLLGDNNEEERLMRKRRFMELQNEFAKEFLKDKVEFDKCIALSSSSSSTSRGHSRTNGRNTSRKHNKIK